MRRLIPFIIVAVGLAALAVDLLPITRPGTDPPQPVETRLGLDLQGGLRGEYQAFSEDGRTPTTGDMATIRSIIERRVNATGVTEPVVQTQGTDRVIVEIPGVSNEDEVRGLIGATGRLDFVPLPPDRYGTETQPSQLYPAPGTRVYEQDPELKPLFSGDQLENAAPAIDQNGQRAVSFQLKSEGARLFGDYTQQSVGNFFAIVLDGEVVSAPSIQSAITGGNGQITGNFSASEMNNLVTVLKFGALPLQLREVSFSSISATLGADFLRQSILAGAVGIGLVFAFMLLYYRLPGLVACIALLYYTAVVLAIFRLIPVTLTLAGVAAFVLSVGMAVDANILIFERMKEELRAGKTIQAAMEAGFNRAWNSILDSNVSSLITAGILYYFGSPVIRGFALVFMIGVLVSMFTAVTLSRQLLRWVVRQPWARRARLYGVHEDEFTLAAPRARSRLGARV
jgi:preprotein translocase subunit SecD